MARRIGVRDAIADLAGEGITFFTIDVLKQRLALDGPKAHQLAMRMVEANTARRIRRGLYVLRQPQEWGDPDEFGTDWYRVAASLAEPGPYYLGYYTAMDVHQMIQHPLRTVFIAVPGPRRGVTTGPVRFRFVVVGERRFFGLVKHRVEAGETVQVSDLERTFVDCADRFDLCGGLEEVFRGFARRHAELDADRLVRYAYQFDRAATTKRLGFLLEQVGHSDPDLLDGLERAGGRFKRYLPLVPGEPTTGAVRNRRWEILVNVDMAALRKATRS